MKMLVTMAAEEGEILHDVNGNRVVSRTVELHVPPGDLLMNGRVFTDVHILPAVTRMLNEACTVRIKQPGTGDLYAVRKIG